MGTVFPGVVGLALWIFAIVLAVCWIIFPFALIGTKPLLRQLLREQQKTNELLQAIRNNNQP